MKGKERMCEEESVRGLAGYMTLSSILHTATVLNFFFCMYNLVADIEGGKEAEGV